MRRTISSIGSVSINSLINVYLARYVYIYIDMEYNVLANFLLLSSVDRVLKYWKPLATDSDKICAATLTFIFSYEVG